RTGGRVGQVLPDRVVLGEEGRQQGDQGEEDDEPERERQAQPTGPPPLPGAGAGIPDGGHLPRAGGTALLLDDLRHPYLLSRGSRAAYDTSTTRLMRITIATNTAVTPC